MGIFKIFSRFIFLFLGTTIWFFLLINLLNQFGVNPFEAIMYDLGITSIENPEETYFGFTSFLNALHDFPEWTFANDVADLFISFARETSSAGEQLANLGSSTGVWYQDVINAVTSIAVILSTPLRFIGTILICIGSLAVNIWKVIWWLLTIIGGTYNSPLPVDPYLPTSQYF